MKKFVCLLVSGLLLVCSRTTAQEVVYLRNGSVIKGSVIEQMPNQSIKVQTKDGSIFVYAASEVERITKENPRNSSGSASQERHTGLDFNFDIGFDIATKGGGGSLFADIGLGKRFNKNIYWGIGTGIQLPTAAWKPLIPLTSDLRVYFPLRNTSLTPGGIFRAGYVFSTQKNAPNYIQLQLMPSLTIPVSNGSDLNVGIGYTHFIVSKGGGGSGAITLSTGFNFHHANHAANGAVVSKAKPKKEPKPVIDHGIQLTFELGAVGGTDMDFDVTGTVAATYKWNPRLAFGVGLGYGSPYVFGIDSSVSDTRFFLRGQYKFTQTRFAPFASLDTGLHFMSPKEEFPWTEEFPGSRFFFAPAVGGALRLGSNASLDLKIGYEWAPRVSISRYDTTIDMSRIFATLSFTQTFNWGSGWRK